MYNIFSGNHLLLEEHAMNILITGGTGFIGRTLIKNLQKESHKITVLSRTPDTINKISGAPISSGFETLQTRGSI